MDVIIRIFLKYTYLTELILTPEPQTKKINSFLRTQLRWNISVIYVYYRAADKKNHSFLPTQLRSNISVIYITEPQTKKSLISTNTT